VTTSSEPHERDYDNEFVNEPADQPARKRGIELTLRASAGRIATESFFGDHRKRAAGFVDDGKWHRSRRR
jgi:hypothetical protein